MLGRWNRISTREWQPDRSDGTSAKSCASTPVRHLAHPLLVQLQPLRAAPPLAHLRARPSLRRALPRSRVSHCHPTVLLVVLRAPHICIGGMYSNRCLCGDKEAKTSTLICIHVWQYMPVAARVGVDLDYMFACLDVLPVSFRICIFFLATSCM